MGIGAGQGFTATPEAWVEAADRNLYNAKQSGRNMVKCTGLDGNSIDLAQAG